MEKTDSMPIWVFLAFSSISTRKGAVLLVRACILFALYSIPWSGFFVSQAWVANLFLIDDWSWFAMMAPITAWYWISLKWVDRNAGWTG